MLKALLGGNTIVTQLSTGQHAMLGKGGGAMKVIVHLFPGQVRPGQLMMGRLVSSAMPAGDMMRHAMVVKREHDVP